MIILNIYLKLTKASDLAEKERPSSPKLLVNKSSNNDNKIE